MLMALINIQSITERLSSKKRLVALSTRQNKCEVVD